MPLKKAADITRKRIKSGRKKRRKAFDKGARNIDTVFDPMSGSSAFR